MNYEEKYNDLLSRIKRMADVQPDVTRAAIESLFPELKKSGDEMIRKALIYHYQGDGCISTNEYRIDYKEIRAFLEKQSTPQVRTGLEWVDTINDACNKRYSEEYAHGEYCHEQSFKWGFQEGIDWLEKQGQVKDSAISQHENKTCKENSNSLTSEDVRKGLIQYFSTFSLDTFAGIDPKKILAWIKSQGEQKPAWSEEDEEMVQVAINACNSYQDSLVRNDSRFDKAVKVEEWLKSLKDRYTWKPSDEHYELEEFAKIVRSNLTGISKSVQELFEAKYLQLTGNKMYRGFKD